MAPGATAVRKDQPDSEAESGTEVSEAESSADARFRRLGNTCSYPSGADDAATADIGTCDNAYSDASGSRQDRSDRDPHAARQTADRRAGGSRIAAAAHLAVVSVGSVV